LCSFSHSTIVKKLNHGKKDVKDNRKSLLAFKKAAKSADTLKKRPNSPAPLLNGKDKIIKTIQPSILGIVKTTWQ